MRTLQITDENLSSYNLSGLLPWLPEVLQPLSREYPGFQTWFNAKVLTGLLTGTRLILVSMENDEIAGIAILKRDKLERKICTLRVVPAYRGKGYGGALMDYARRLLRTDHPLITVPSSRLSEFQTILCRHEFELVQRLPDYYLDGQTEYVFNGYLHVRNSSEVLTA